MKTAKQRRRLQGSRENLFSGKGFEPANFKTSAAQRNTGPLHPGWTLPKTQPRAAEQQPCRGQGAPNCFVFWEKERVLHSEPAFPSPQSSDLCMAGVQLLQGAAAPRRGKVSRRKQTPTSSRSLKHHYKHQRAEGRATAASPGARPFLWLQTDPLTSQYLRRTGKGRLYYCSVIGILRISCWFWSFLFSFRNSTRFCRCYHHFNSFYNKIFVIRNCALICVRLMDSIKALSGEAEWMGLQKWRHQGNWYLNSQSADPATKTCKYESCFISSPWQNSPEEH